MPTVWRIAWAGSERPRRARERPCLWLPPPAGKVPRAVDCEPISYLLHGPAQIPHQIVQGSRT